MDTKINDVERMLSSVRDTQAVHDPDLKKWITAAIYRFVTGYITLQEVQMLDRVCSLNVHDKSQRYRMYTIIENARQHEYYE